VNCPRCRQENLPQAKFCQECGARVAALCPQCRSEAPPSAKFCPEAVAAWTPHVKNFGPNIGHDYGGRLMAAWLDT